MILTGKDILKADLFYEQMVYDVASICPECDSKSLLDLERPMDGIQVRPGRGCILCGYHTFPINRDYPVNRKIGSDRVAYSILYCVVSTKMNPMSDLIIVKMPSSIYEHGDVMSTFVFDEFFIQKAPVCVTIFKDNRYGVLINPKKTYYERFIELPTN